MSIATRLASAVLITTALTAPNLAFAQAAEPVPAEDNAATPDQAAETPAQEQVEVSAPGGEIVVTGNRVRNIERSAPQVVSVLSSAEIARTGEGNIAGALGRVTGLSVVGSGYVYVRGLGDRYSLALLNGSPLPSPEPLKRVVPLDLFPSSVIASSLVQKSYSANYPGEFGGGVINLTTKAVPRDPFLSIGFGVSGDTETTSHLGYTYYGSGSDWAGFDNGQRNLPPALQAFLGSGARISSGTVDTPAIASQLVTGRNSAVQRWQHLPANFSGSLTGAKSWDIGATNLGLIAALGYSNKWLTRQPHQQRSLSADLSTIESDFTGLNTDNRIVVNGLLGVGLEFGENKLRWTNLIIRDTVKQARLATGKQNQTNVDYMRQNTAWYERQLINTQLVGEFKLTPDLSLDLRGSYAKSSRNAPFELYFEYLRTNAAADPLGAYFVNRLNNGNGGDARVTFSELDETLWSGSGDLSYKALPGLSVTIGGAFSDTRRTSSRRQFQFLAPGVCEGVPSTPSSCLPSGVTLLRPDYLLGPDVVKTFRIGLIESDEGNPAFLAQLRNAAGYAKVNWQIADSLSIDAGLRYEWARLRVDPIQVFTVPGAATAGTSQTNGYWLPGATLTWEVQPQMQVRVSASKTIARPQFRELINQPYYDPDTNREYRGNPLLVDSQLYNAEARFEWYFAPEQRLSLAGFYKKIDRPIEAFINPSFVTSYANAPRATLYGVEFDVQKRFSLGDEGFLAARRLLLVGNYTFTKSKLKVAPGDEVQVFGAFSTSARDYFTDGAKLTGQSDHIVNFEIGLENQDKLSQQTIMVTYASDRVVSRGVFGSPPQPDVFEQPGLRVDFVAREGFSLLGKELELKFEARNLTGRRHVEYQRSGGNRLDVNSYAVGRTFSLSASLKF
ncbi:TonB-dependent receptor [Novosphingobium sp.]|uniref:TonB-dependent receptor domain-containing protein n=1 Tax=Novosphingobium sp. TaxID=1874826 RepID=UPI001EB85EE4|nr:TonB-dependent receptor [Novosphingobium sp.]MBK9010630.1 TonB-dependent receptor [Novosphingobium sp.]